MTSRTKLKRKNVDDVLGGAETWKDADSTAGECFFLFIAHANI
jgi:DNA-directed RNA polymerase III subunit RPC11